jgi:hypothetical protein
MLYCFNIFVLINQTNNLMRLLYYYLSIPTNYKYSKQKKHSNTQKKRRGLQSFMSENFVDYYYILQTHTRLYVGV